MESKQEFINYLKTNIPKEHILLLGNGINRLNRGNRSWEKILKDLINDVGLKKKVQIGKQKPFPLLFEEILNRMKKGTFDENLKKLKTNVKKQIENSMEPNEYHKAVVNLKYDQILTTNYDYHLETSIDKEFKKHNNKGKTKQYLYSDKRVNLVNNKYIWHIHGELDNGYVDDKRYPAQSIMLGFDHYTSYLTKIYKFLVNSVKSENKEKIKKELKSAKVLDKRWYYYIFTSHIDIIGLDLTPSEIHLWWLFNYRSKLQKRKGIKKNTITYFIPSYEMLLKKDTIDLLSSFNIEIKPIHSDFNNGSFYEGFYDNFMKEISKQ